MRVGNGEISMNNITVVGIISSDLREANDGKVINLSISERSINERQFIDCVAFNQTAETIKRLCKKGTLVSVNGVLSLKPYTNKQGQEVKQTKVIINSFEVLKDGADFKAPVTPKPTFTPSNAPITPPKIDEANTAIISDDDLPF